MLNKVKEVCGKSPIVTLMFGVLILVLVSLLIRVATLDRKVADLESTVPYLADEQTVETVKLKLNGEYVDIESIDLSKLSAGDTLETEIYYDNGNKQSKWAYVVVKGDIDSIIYVDGEYGKIIIPEED